MWGVVLRFYSALEEMFFFCRQINKNAYEIRILFRSPEALKYKFYKIARFGNQ